MFGVDKVLSATLEVEYVDDVGHKQTNEYVESGHYGTKSEINKQPLKGQLVHVRTLNKPPNETNLGCGPLDPEIIPATGMWVALVKRGTCDFNDKIYYATRNSTAAAVIVYNSKESENFQNVTMSTEGNFDVQGVVAIHIHCDKGKQLVSLLRDYEKINITIKHVPNEKTPPDNPEQLNNMSVMFVSISFIVLIIISLAWLVFYYIQRCRYTNAKERLSRRLANAAKKAIGRIPQRSLKLGDKELDAEADQCAVCIEPYKWNDVIRILPCKHVFHKSCVDPWLLDQRSCPMCKMDILRAFGMHLNDSQESVPQDAESGAMSSTGAADDTEHLSNSEEQGAVGGVKIVLYQHPVRFHETDSGQFQESDFSSDASLNLHSSPVAQCHVECAGSAFVEHDTNGDSCAEEEPCLAKTSGSNGHSQTFDDDNLDDCAEEQRLLISGEPSHGPGAVSRSKSPSQSGGASSISSSIRDEDIAYRQSSA